MPVIKLHQNMISELTVPEGKKRIEWVDADFPGLFLEVRAGSQSKKTWWFRYRGDGSQSRTKRLGHSGTMPLAEARQMARTVKAEVELGADPVAEAKAQKAIITFDDFFYNHYLPYAKPRKRSWDRDEELYRLRIAKKWGSRRLDQLTRQQLLSFQTELLAEGLAPATVNHHSKLTRRILTLAVEWNFIKQNVASRIGMLPEDNQIERYMDDEELAKLLAVLTTDRRRIVCLIALWLLSTGARLNEALSATWDQVDKEKRVWRIPASNSKSKRMRPVPLNDAAMEVLQQLDTEGVYSNLFINKKTKMPYVNIAKVWSELRLEAGLPHVRLHDLRHQAASMLVNSGASLFIVQQVLGHANPVTSQRYAHLAIQTLHDASAGASAIISKAMPMQRGNVSPIR